ncbi:MAG: hypothetical protein D6813_01615, partial [Calditrichaeota bacterium]
KKKLTRRQIKEDKLVTYYFKTTDYLRQNSRFLSSLIIGLAIIVFLTFLYAKNKSAKEENAAVELTKAKAEYFQKNYESAIKLLEDLVEEYGGTKSGTVGLYYLADAYFNLKKYEQAEQYFREYLDRGGDDILEAASLSGLAACLEQKGQYLEAAKTYEKAAEKYKNSFLAPESLFNAARCYELAGEKELAKQKLKEILERYKDTNIKNDVEIYLAELSSQTYKN